jgi:hypothetical protein
MRLSSLVFATILLVSATLLAQHSSGGGGSSSGGSHGGYSGGSGSSVSSASSHTSSSSASYVGGASTASHSSSSSKSPSPKENAATEKQSSRSLFHPFRKAKLVQSAEFKSPAPCLKAPCAVCPPGQSRSGNRACAVVSNACSSGQVWNGFSCGAQGWFSDCNALARELAEQRRQMQSQSDYGQSLRYRMLQNQYDQCMRRSRSGFGAYAFNNALLLDTP